MCQPIHHENLITEQPGNLTAVIESTGVPVLRIAFTVAAAVFAVKETHLH